MDQILYSLDYTCILKILTIVLIVAIQIVNPNAIFQDHLLPNLYGIGYTNLLPKSNWTKPVMRSTCLIVRRVRLKKSNPENWIQASVPKIPPKNSQIVKWGFKRIILGKNPERFPYAEDDGMGNIKQCCGNKTYNPFTFTCCDDQVMEIGSC